MKIPIIFSKKCLAYGRRHKEGPTRIEAIQKMLKEKGFSFFEPDPVSKEDLLRVHDLKYITGIMNGSLRDREAPSYNNIYKYAALSAGGAILAAKTKGFSIMRPPGHHAGINGPALGVKTRGYCYFNNIAVAVKYLDKPTLILDIDGHHGNGTQEIFQGDKKVTFVSIHRHPEYPGTGYLSTENCLNFPLRPNCGERVYLETLEKAFDASNKNNFEIIAVSAGFDTLSGDIGSLGLRGKTYQEIGKKIASLGKTTFFVLEGGYNRDKIGSCVSYFLEGFEG
jgi:acetoin utilization deacetylase AcuC-like enzyme